MLGADAAPLLVIGPRPLRRALLAYAELEPLTFVYLDNVHTLVRVIGRPLAMQPWKRRQAQ